MKMPWGKYKDQDVEDLPVDYITWVLGNTNVSDNNPALAKELENQLDAREGRGIDRGKA